MRNNDGSGRRAYRAYVQEDHRLRKVLPKTKEAILPSKIISRDHVPILQNDRQISHYEIKYCPYCGTKLRESFTKHAEQGCPVFKQDEDMSDEISHNALLKGISNLTPSGLGESAGRAIGDGVIGTGKGFGDAYLSGYSSLLDYAWGGAATTASNAWDGAAPIVSNAWDGAATATSNAWDGAATAASNAWDGAATATSNVWNTVTGWF